MTDSSARLVTTHLAGYSSFPSEGCRVLVPSFHAGGPTKDKQFGRRGGKIECIVGGRKQWAKMCLISSGDLYFVEYLIAQSCSLGNCNDKLSSINRQRGLLNYWLFFFLT